MDERMRILKMIEDGIINAEEGAKLMDALSAPSATAAPPAALQPETDAADYDSKMLYVTVDSKKDGDRVNIRFPIGAIRRILKITGKLPIPEEKLNGIDLPGLIDAVTDCLDSRICGDIVDVSSSDGSTVRIYVE